MTPSVDEPWDFLDYNPETGLIVPRYYPDLDGYLPKGEQTVEVLHLDRREAMAIGYQRSFRRIKRTVEAVLEQANPDPDELLHALREADDHGLLGWCFDGLGSQKSPFKDLCERHPAVWEVCQRGYREP